MPGRREVLLSAMAVGCLAGCLDDDAGDVDGGEQGDGVSDDDTPGSDDDTPGATGSDSDDTSEPEGADDGRGDESEEGETADGGEEGSDETENTPRDHPLAADLGSLPTRGNPATATATIVDVSDVSCPLCREFHQGAYEELSSAYIDGGELAYVYRAIPGLDTGWNVPATHALYETLEREGEAAFWSLAEFYYREQDGLDEGNVIERTEEFLHRIVEEPDAVVEAAETETHTGMIENTIAAAREAGIEGVPTFYLFREGEYLTTIEGNQSAEVFENALSL